MDPPDHCPDEIYDLMCVCWELEPGRRPSFPSIQTQLAQAAAQDSGGTPSRSPVVMRKALGVPNGELVGFLWIGELFFKAYSYTVP